jgi:nucleoside-diphosphate-sugar epimerase
VTRAVIIGGTGHVGTYLVPRLVTAGFEVINVSRAERQPYHPHTTWRSVRTVTLDRDLMERSGSFGREILALKPDILIDMICFTAESARHLADSLAGHVQHFLHCGTIWVHGPSVMVPTTEMAPRRPFGAYGMEKAAVETYLLDRARRSGFPATLIHPGHIVGPGWEPLNPAGHFNPEVFSVLAKGQELSLPNLGMETVHHVHADDVAQAFMGAIAHRSVALGEAFHAVSPAALTLRGYAEAMALWFGQKANLSYAPWPEWKRSHSELEATQAYDHIAHSPNCSIAKAEGLLGYRPRYSSLDAVCESVAWLVEQGIVKTRQRRSGEETDSSTSRPSPKKGI